MTPQVVRKSEFAAICHVTPGRVSQWIAEGRIVGEALVGEGRAAQIRVDVAQAQLREALDPAQRFGTNGLATTLDAPAPAAPRDSVESQLKNEKLRQAQLQTARLEEQDRLQRGLYVLASEARTQTARAVAEALNIFEGSLSDFASALAAKFSLPQRDLVHALRHEFRAVRARASAARASAAAGAPEHIEAGDPVPTEIQ